jgi:hypothetical protein
MLTVSIAESLSMGPEAWSQWRNNAEMVAQADAMQWEMLREQWEVAQHLAGVGVAGNAAAMGGDISHANFPGAHYTNDGLPGWDLAQNLQSEFDQELQGFDQWATGLSAKGLGSVDQPQKLTIGGARCRAPLASLASSLASPIRVPLPAPCQALDGDALALPPGLEALEPDAPAQRVPARPDQPRASPRPAPVGTPPAAAAAEPLKAKVLEAPSQGGLTAAAPTGDAPQGISIQQGGLPGSAMIEWGIDSFCGKLQSNGSRPMVSPPFSACGLPNLRLMVSVAAREPAKSRGRERKGAAKSTAALKRGPLQGALKLKADCLQGATVMTFNLHVGPAKSGPFTYDFSQQAVHGPDDFGVDWREQVDGSNGTLRVGVEILEVRK